MPRCATSSFARGWSRRAPTSARGCSPTRAATACLARAESLRPIRRDDPQRHGRRPRAPRARRVARRARALGRPARARQPQRARLHGARDRARARAWHRRGRTRQQQPLDARRQLRLAGRRRRRHRHLLDQHPAQPAAVGRERPRIGNNPLVIAVPRAAGTSCSTWRCRSSRTARSPCTGMRGEQLPVDGGFDADGRADARSRGDRGDASGRCRSASGRAPASRSCSTWSRATLSGGARRTNFRPCPSEETGQSQVFIAIDASALGAAGESDGIVDRIVDALRTRRGSRGGGGALPGRAHARRCGRRTSPEGVPVN